MAKLNNGESSRILVLTDKNLHILSTDFKVSKTHAIPFDSEQQHVYSPEKKLILFELNNSSVLYNLNTNTKSEYPGKIKVKRVNNKCLIANFQKTKLTLLRISKIIY